MLVLSLQSGSNGNCIYVETRGIRLLFDAGISGKQAEARLAQYDRDIRQVDALVISHDHSDHTRSAGIFQRKFGLPVYLTADTLDVVQSGRSAISGGTRLFHAGDPLVFGEVTIETIPTPHDGVDGVAFVVDDGRSRLGILTDLGHLSEHNNHPELALRVHRHRLGSKLPLHVASRYQAAAMLEV